MSQLVAHLSHARRTRSHEIAQDRTKIAQRSHTHRTEIACSSHKSHTRRTDRITSASITSHHELGIWSCDHFFNLEHMRWMYWATFQVARRDHNIARNRALIAPRSHNIAQHRKDRTLIAHSSHTHRTEIAKIAQRSHTHRNSSQIVA